MPSPVKFYHDNDNVHQIDGLWDEVNQVYFTVAASITGQLRDSADGAIGSASTYVFLTGSSGVFHGVFDKALVTAAETTGSILVTGSEGTVEFELVIPVVFEDRDDPRADDAITISIKEAAERPLMMRTEEGTVRERDMDEIIAADRYASASAATEAPFGMRVARIKSGGSTPSAQP